MNRSRWTSSEEHELGHYVLWLLNPGDLLTKQVSLLYFDKLLNLSFYKMRMITFAHHRVVLNI